MRSLKIAVAGTLILSCGKIYSKGNAGWPLDNETIVTSNVNLLNAVKTKNNRTNFVTVNKQIVSPGILINPDYAGGQFKKTEVKGLNAILHWDMKVKFRLNRNMNVVFSYN
jgi:hypothetical protein